MLSKIKVEIDFDHNNEPIIEVLYRQSDDVRDKLIKSFIDKLRQVSSWCEIHCANAMQETDVNYAVQRWIIKPIEPEQLEDRANVINEQVRILKECTPLTGIPKAKIKLPGEFTFFERRDQLNNIIGIDVFYNGVEQATWLNPNY